MHFWDDYTCVLKGTCSPAEAPIKDLKLGVTEYLAMVPPSKLVLALPWYDIAVVHKPPYCMQFLQSVIKL